MKLSAQTGSRYGEVARAIAEHKRELRNIRTYRGEAASEKRKALRGSIEDLLGPHLTEQTVHRMRLALIAHACIERGMRDPLLREVGLTHVFGTLSAAHIQLLLNAYGDRGEYRKTPELDYALSQLSHVCRQALEQRHIRMRDEQLAEARKAEHPTTIEDFKDVLDPDLLIELEAFGIFTAFEMSCHTTDQLRMLTCRPDSEIERAREALDGIGLAFAE